MCLKKLSYVMSTAVAMVTAESIKYRCIAHLDGYCRWALCVASETSRLRTIDL